MTKWFLTYWPLLLCGFNCIGGLIIWALHKTYAKHEKVDLLETEVKLIRNDISNLPDKDLTHKLELRIEELSGDIKRIEPGLNSVKNLSDMLLENELKGRSSCQ